MTRSILPLAGLLLLCPASTLRAQNPTESPHDLVKDVLTAMDIDVERVVITELRSSTYYAELYLRRGGERSIVSSRPSDAVAVAGGAGGAARRRIARGFLLSSNCVAARTSSCK